MYVYGDVWGWVWGWGGYEERWGGWDGMGMKILMWWGEDVWRLL